MKNKTAVQTIKLFFVVIYDWCECKIWAHGDLWSHQIHIVSLFDKTSLESVEIYISFRIVKTEEKNPNPHSVFGTIGLFI